MQHSPHTHILFLFLLPTNTSLEWLSSLDHKHTHMMCRLRVRPAQTSRLVFLARQYLKGTPERSPSYWNVVRHLFLEFSFTGFLKISDFYTCGTFPLSFKLDFLLSPLCCFVFAQRILTIQRDISKLYFSVVVTSELKTCHLLARWLLDFFFDPEDGGAMFLRNVGCYTTDYTAS
jgi:hypothetical protein